MIPDVPSDCPSAVNIAHPQNPPLDLLKGYRACPCRKYLQACI